jgi:hypothetical protein
MVLFTAAAEGLTGGTRYLVFGVWKWDANPDLTTHFVPLVDQARAAGFNAVRVHIPWYLVESTPGRDDHLELFDARLDYVIRQAGLKAVVSLDLTRRGPDAVAAADDLQQDGTGAIARGVNDRCMISFAAAPAVEAAAAFVSRMVAHFHARYGADPILAYSVTYSLYCESEYWVGGRLLDYSPPAQRSFRDWCAQRYGTIAALNAAWGTQYPGFGAVEPPAHLHGAAGQSWYVFRHAVLKRLNDRVALAVRHGAPGARVAQQYGSVWDALAPARGTIAFPELAAAADLVCIDDAPDYPFAWSMDLLRGSLPGTQIANECDRPAIGTDAQYLEQTRVSFARGATCVFFANWDDDPGRLSGHEATLFAPIRALLLDPVTDPPIDERLVVSAAELLQSGSELARARYRALGAGGRRSISVQLQDDLTRNGAPRDETVVGEEPRAGAASEDAGPDPALPAPASVALYPNPASDGLTVACQLRAASVVDLDVYAADGRRTRHLTGAWWPAGLSQIRWDGRDDQGTRVASGVYFIRLSGPAGHAVARAALAR